jgi:hypothetical protein
VDPSQVNFLTIPLQYRLLAYQTVALFWNVYLANKANKNDDDVDWESQMGSHWPKTVPPQFPEETDPSSSQSSALVEPADSAPPCASYPPVISLKQDDECSKNGEEGGASFGGSINFGGDGPGRPPSGGAKYLGGVSRRLFPEFPQS